MLALAHQKTHTWKKRGKKNGEELLRKRLPAGVVVFVLVVELERKLNLPRIVRRITGRADFAKVRVLEVYRAPDSHVSVAAKSRRGEARVVEPAETLCPALQRDCLLAGKFFDEREIQPMETRRGHPGSSL